VHDEEENDGPGDEEMDGARGLASAECVDKKGKRGVEAGRQREAGPDDEGKENADDAEVSGALEHVIGVCFAWIGWTAAEIFRHALEVGARGALTGRGNEVATEVAIEKTEKCVDESGEDKEPRGLKVQVAAPAVLVGHIGAVAIIDCVARGGDGDGEERVLVDVAGFAPVEAGMGDDEFKAGDEQREEAEDCEPMGDADERGMARSGHSGERVG